MPRKGYSAVTLPNETIKRIDAKITKQNDSRPKVIEYALDAIDSKRMVKQ